RRPAGRDGDHAGDGAPRRDAAGVRVRPAARRSLPGNAVGREGASLLPRPACTVTQYGMNIQHTMPPADWLAPIAAFDVWLASAGRPESTRYLRCYHMRRL